MKLKIYIVSVLTLLMSSCANWLDVVPSDTVVETELFKEATGYRNALNGVYKQISQPTMYGKEMTWGFMDVMVNYYGGISRSKPYYKAFNNFDYANKDVKIYFQNIWEKSYNSIANCNNIITKLSTEKPAKFSLGQSEIDLIKGEALALRGLLHFDMLRMFAPSTVNNDGGVYIPYHDKYPSHGEAKLTNEEIKRRVIRDLREARDLVAKFDTLDRSHIIWLGPSFRFESKQGNGAQTDDIFFAYRGYRMNYPAITAILARVYNYFGMHEDAKTEAEKIIDLSFPEHHMNYVSFTLKESIAEEANVLMTNDLIFALSHPKLHEDFQYHTLPLKSELFYLTNYSSIFDDPADYRSLATSSTDGRNYYSLKTLGKAGAKYEIVKDMIPMIRLSEMHYILAEYYASKDDFSAATLELDKVRIGRGCKKDRLTITNQTSFVNELIKEAKREFISEGQLFYYYKKYNKMISSKMKPEYFVFPLPDSQNVNF